MKFATTAVHAGIQPDPSTGSIMTPIFQTSTYVQSGPGQHKGYAYARGANPTRTALQESLAALEGGKHALCFSSGMGAIDTTIKLLSAGDEVVASSDLYGGSYRMFVGVFASLGIQFRFVHFTDLDALCASLSDRTRMIWVETPSNPLMQVVDIAACAALARSKGILTVVDNTFASPYLQNPLALGADIVVHSLTKYISGHSDVVMGALVANNDALIARLAFIQNSCGPTPGPMDCFLALRGIKTLHLRMERHCYNAEKVAFFLASHTKVANVYWPGMPHHPGYAIAKRQMKGGFGGMVSIELKAYKADSITSLAQNMKLFSLAESLGGVESLISHPASMTHASIPAEMRAKNGIHDSLLRLSIGIEDSNDLIADLDFALSRL